MELLNATGACKALLASVLLLIFTACGQPTSPGAVPVLAATSSDVPSLEVASELSLDRSDPRYFAKSVSAIPSFIPALVPTVYRFAKYSSGAYFYTGNEDEVRQIFANYPDFRYEGPAFEKDTTGHGQQVFRFANLQNGGYFYTGSEQERDIVLRNYPHMRFEGTSFSVAPMAEAAAEPIHRLANTQNGAYLYTTSVAERDYALSLGVWRAEGSTFKAAMESPLKNRAWKPGQLLEQGDTPVDDFDVKIDDLGRAMVVFYKEVNGRRSLFASRGLPGAVGIQGELAWTPLTQIDLNATGTSLSDPLPGRMAFPL
jgi:Repeat of unknown function (DUF5648)